MSYPGSKGQWHGANVLVADLTGTIELTNGATTIAGTTTDFENELQAGDIIYDTVDKFAVIVDTITNATTAVAKGKYQGTGGAAHACKRIRNSNGDAVNIPAGYNVVLPASTGDAAKVLTSDFKTNETLVIECEEDALICFVKASTAANEIIAVNALMRSQFTADNLTKAVILNADTEYKIPVRFMMQKGFELYIRRLNGAASTYNWYSYSE